MLEHPLDRYPGASLHPRASGPRMSGIYPPGNCPPTSTMLSPPHCLTANAAESKEKTNKKTHNRLREGHKRNAKIRFSLMKWYKKN